jgi:hypothetical protein
MHDFAKTYHKQFNQHNQNKTKEPTTQENNPQISSEMGFKKTTNDYIKAVKVKHAHEN